MPWRLVVRDYGYVGARDLPVFKCVYMYKTSECKHAIVRLHCATSKSLLWNMEYVARGSGFKRPHIYRTSTHLCLICTYVYMTSLKQTVRCHDLSTIYLRFIILHVYSHDLLCFTFRRSKHPVKVHKCKMCHWALHI